MRLVRVEQVCRMRGFRIGNFTFTLWGFVISERFLESGEKMNTGRIREHTRVIFKKEVLK